MWHQNVSFKFIFQKRVRKICVACVGLYIFSEHAHRQVRIGPVKSCFSLVLRCWFLGVALDWKMRIEQKRKPKSDAAFTVSADVPPPEAGAGVAVLQVLSWMALRVFGTEDKKNSSVLHTWMYRCLLKLARAVPP
jgi:hypothetical protein